MHPPDRLPLDAQAETLAGLEWPRLLEALGERLATPAGADRLAGLAPLPRLGAVRHALARVAELSSLREQAGPLDFSGVHGLEGLLERAARQGRLEAEELAAVLATQRAALKLRADLQFVPGLDTLAELAAEVQPLRELVERLSRALTPMGTLDERMYPELGRLRQQLAEGREAIHRKLEGLLRASRLADAFQDQIYTLRGRRYVLPVKADFKGHLAGIVHDVSASGATLFMEPQAVVEDTNALTLTERLLELEQDRILRELSAEVGSQAPALAANLAWIGRVDLLHAQAALAEAYRGTVPRVEAEGVLELKGLAHPLLLLEEPPAGEVPAEGALPRAVRNDLRLGGETRCMVISGANTGGKTVLLKAVGLCALLVRHGMPIPALGGSRCDWFDAVWADVGDQQSLETSLSTFSAQIRFLASTLPAAGTDHLVLLDEMLTGTEPAQGAALGAAVLDALLAQGATTLVTTHFGELKEFAAHRPGIVNASMAFDAAGLRPTFRLQVGLPGASFAVHIARRHGLPEPIVARAEASLADRPAALDALLVQLSDQQQRLEQAEERLRQREGRLQRAEAELEGGRSALEGREAELRRRERGAISAELRTARRRIGTVIRELQQAKSLPTVSRVREHLAELEREHEAGEPRPTAGAGAAAPSGPLEPGAPVWLPALRRRAVLETLLDGGRRARVRLGSVSMELAAEEVAPAPGGEPSGGHSHRRGSAPPVEPGGATALAMDAGPGEVAAGRPAPIAFALSTEENTLDVRGLRLDEALEQTEAFLDRCTMKHVSPVMLIHGHGTGRLKLGLREALRESPYVAAFRPGDAGEGRDGVTIAALNL